MPKRTCRERQDTTTKPENVPKSCRTRQKVSAKGRNDGSSHTHQMDPQGKHIAPNGKTDASGASRRYDGARHMPKKLQQALERIGTVVENSPPKVSGSPSDGPAAPRKAHNTREYRQCRSTSTRRRFKCLRIYYCCDAQTVQNQENREEDTEPEHKPNDATTYDARIEMTYDAHEPIIRIIIDN